MSLSQTDYVIQLPKTPATIGPLDPRAIAQKWLTGLESLLTTGSFAQLPALFHEDSWWRDRLALTWDLRSIQSRATIQAFLAEHQPGAAISALRLQHEGKVEPDQLDVLLFETRVGRGEGVLRLTLGEDGVWKAYSMYTALQELKGLEEPLGIRRPHGTIETMPRGLAGGNWLERRQRLRGFREEEPTALIVGAGQAGLNIAARLQSLGVSHLIVDRNERVGDNWRKRYRTLVTHDPAEFTHMAYLPFPPNWPLFTPKDKLADWFEAYASIMELNVWLSTSIISAVYDDSHQTWTVTVTRTITTTTALSPTQTQTETKQETRTLHPRHLIWCTGHSGEPLVPTFKDQDQFSGRIYHASEHTDASTDPTVTGKRVVVVGTGNSGHDIAQNYYENGAAQVTMLQRSGTYVITADKGVMMMMHEGLHEDNGPPGLLVPWGKPRPVSHLLEVSGAAD
ncbi:FAD/NAD(P)-binding domain-containing protein [Aspergillus ellipticus CBS 707.79]|uniref:FAD/NAD(P)-binding domain-containing protein n=1 Tax=Aspergillus ellipticus CBS 707.79 TaxID=1448320 RepID=A0A319DF17_9EURO|nr:FAD/NAD(P)-binding domain-containing protein [Aspergillus ellipticus CBS 707.79]